MKPTLCVVNWMRPAGLSALALVLAGCATGRVYQMYDGSPRPADQVARLVVPNAIDVYSIDGKVVYDFLLKAGKSEVHLLPGPHSVVARYNKIWVEGPEGQQAVKSGLVGMNFDARAGRCYRIAFPEPQDLDAAVKFADHVKLWIEDTRPDTPATVAAKPTLAKPDAASSPAPASSNTPVAAKPDAESLPLQNLKFWWQKAGEQDRRQFKEWSASPP